jgi:hypothetical protein
MTLRRPSTRKFADDPFALLDGLAQWTKGPQIGCRPRPREGGAVMNQLKWIVQMAAAALTLLALLDQGRKNGWI